MRDCAALSQLPREIGAFPLRCRRRLRRQSGESQLFGLTNGYTLPCSFQPSPLMVRHKDGLSPVSSKSWRLGQFRNGYVDYVSSRSSSSDISGSLSDGKPESLQDFSGLRSSSSGEREIRRNGSPALSTFEFLELKRELDRQEEAMAGTVEEELIPEESGDITPSSLEKEEILVGKSSRRGGRQVMRRSNLLAKQVISMESARSLGFVSQLWVDTRSWMVVLVEVRPNLLSGDAEKFLLDDVYQVGDVVLVQDETVMQNEVKMTALDTLVGYDVVKPGRRSIGKIRGYTFNINNGYVETLEFDSFGFAVIPSSLVSTYCLLVEDVFDVESDKIIVHEEALSNIQRLTKGIWDAPNISKSGDKMDAYPVFRRKSAYSDGRGRRQNFRGLKPSRDDTYTDDDWDLPMDY